MIPSQFVTRVAEITKIPIEELMFRRNKEGNLVPMTDDPLTWGKNSNGYLEMRLDRKILDKEMLALYPYRTHTPIAGGALAYFPGCCGLMISTGAYVNAEFKRKGIGELFHELRIAIAKQEGYTVLVCTDVEKNEPQKALLKKQNWKDVFQFKNKRTSNVVNISVKEL